MIKCVYKIIQFTDEGLDVIHLCYRKNYWSHVTWGGRPNVLKEKFKCCPICGNTNIKEIKEEEH